MRVGGGCRCKQKGRLFHRHLKDACTQTHSSKHARTHTHRCIQTYTTKQTEGGTFSPLARTHLSMAFFTGITGAHLDLLLSSSLGIGIASRSSLSPPLLFTASVRSLLGGCSRSLCRPVGGCSRMRRGGCSVGS